MVTPVLAQQAVAAPVMMLLRLTPSLWMGRAPVYPKPLVYASTYTKQS